MLFGGGFFVKLNLIDFNKVFVEFKKFDDIGNVVVIVIVMVVFMVYFFVFFVVRRVDKRDVIKVSFYFKVCWFGD